MVDFNKLFELQRDILFKPIILNDTIYIKKSTFKIQIFLKKKSLFHIYPE